MDMDILFIAHLLNGLLMVAMPVGLAIYLTRRWNWRADLVDRRSNIHPITGWPYPV